MASQHLLYALHFHHSGHPTCRFHPDSDVTSTYAKPSQFFQSPSVSSKGGDPRRLAHVVTLAIDEDVRELIIKVVGRLEPHRRSRRRLSLTGGKSDVLTPSALVGIGIEARLTVFARWQHRVPALEENLYGLGSAIKVLKKCSAWMLGSAHRHHGENFFLMSCRRIAFLSRWVRRMKCVSMLRMLSFIMLLGQAYLPY